LFKTANALQSSGEAEAKRQADLLRQAAEDLFNTTKIVEAKPIFDTGNTVFGQFKVRGSTPDEVETKETKSEKETAKNTKRTALAVEKFSRSVEGFA
jgi:hypothetical protein